MTKKDPSHTAPAGGAELAPTTNPITYTLHHVISLAGGADARLRKVLFRNVDDTVLVDRGTKIDTQNILDDIPDFFFDVRATWAALPADKRKLVVGYAPELDAILATEVKQLAALHDGHKSSAKAGTIKRVKSKAALADLWTQSIALRDQAARSLSQVIGDADGVKEEVKATKGKATSWEELATGIEGTAKLIRQHRASDADLAAAMDLLQLTDAYAGELSTAATELRTAAQEQAAANPDARVTQRQLDLQDGTVLHLVEIVYRAFDGGHDRDATILVPRLGQMAGLIDRKRAPASKTTKDVAAAAAATETTTAPHAPGAGETQAPAAAEATPAATAPKKK